MFQPRWPSSYVQVVCLRELLSCFCIVSIAGSFFCWESGAAMRMFMFILSLRIIYSFVSVRQSSSTQISNQVGMGFCEVISLDA
jgi:hypothetical protein